MKVVLLPSAFGGDAQNQYLSTYLVNDTIAIDAGSLGFWGTPEDQARVRHVLISHSHIDHLASLPTFIENVYQYHASTVTVYGSDAVLDCLQEHIFNDLVWPDMVGLSASHLPFIRLERMEAGRPLRLDGLTVTPVAVDHTVPTLGFIIEDATAAIVITSDTGPTEAIWQHANATANVKAVFLEVTFPNVMAELAALSKHHTPASFAEETRKLGGRPRILAVHLKARYRGQLVAELQALNLPLLELAEPGREYQFS